MSTSPSTSTHRQDSRSIDWKYEPSDEEFIEAQLPSTELGDDALIGPLGAKAIASVTGAVSTSLLSTYLSTQELDLIIRSSSAPSQ